MKISISAELLPIPISMATTASSLWSTTAPWTRPRPWSASPLTPLTVIYR